ncbi:MAG: hypothetical protein KJZ73_08450 [Pseudorhodoplanes sp.]|nr:hypothetical protein [Pseudorhodoplanes sp.]
MNTFTLFAKSRTRKTANSPGDRAVIDDAGETRCRLYADLPAGDRAVIRQRHVVAIDADIGTGNDPRRKVREEDVARNDAVVRKAAYLA